MNKTLINRRFGPYILITQLAVGGMAEIFLALKLGPGPVEKRLVLKCIFEHCQNNRDYVRLFYREAALSAAIQHPNLLNIFDVGSIGGRHTMCMEFLHGVTVDEMLVRSRECQMPVPLNVALQIAICASNGLDYLHKMCDKTGKPLRIVHRDLTPQNIFVSYNGECKIFDYGVAQIGGPEDEDPQRGMLIGKYAYMSPEQCRGEYLDGRSDMFSLGAVLFELVTGKCLFEGENSIQMMDAVLHSDIPKPSSLRAGVSPYLDHIILHLLQRCPAMRYPSADLLSKELQKCFKFGGYHQTNDSLSSYLKKLFAEEIAEFEPFWRHAVEEAEARYSRENPLEGLAVPEPNAFEEELMDGEELVPDEEILECPPPGMPLPSGLFPGGSYH